MRSKSVDFSLFQNIFYLFKVEEKKGETEERNFVKTTSLLTLEEHFASGFTGEYF